MVIKKSMTIEELQKKLSGAKSRRDSYKKQSKKTFFKIEREKLLALAKEAQEDVVSLRNKITTAANNNGVYTPTGRTNAEKRESVINAVDKFKELTVAKGSMWCVVSKIRRQTSHYGIRVEDEHVISILNGMIKDDNMAKIGLIALNKERKIFDAMDVKKEFGMKMDVYNECRRRFHNKVVDASRKALDEVRNKERKRMKNEHESTRKN